MHIGGKWVGLGLGDIDPEVHRFKVFAKRKWATGAAAIMVNEVFDTELLVFVMKIQGVYHAEGKLHAPNGILDFDTKRVSGFIKVAPPAKPTLFTVQGTGVDMWTGPPADTARAVADIYRWQPIGNYPAKAFPMNPSVQQGRAELNLQIDLNPGPFALAGFSQGAIVISEVWEYDIKPENGRLHHRINDCRKAVAWGNPMREKGKFFSDPGGPVVKYESRGIADQLMVDTPSWWRNYAHAGDLYTDVSGQSAENKTAIYKVVMGTRILSGPDSLLAQVLEVLGVKKDAGRLLETIGLFKSLMDAGLFFARGTTPHLNYQVGPAIDYLRAA